MVTGECAAQRDIIYLRLAYRFERRRDGLGDVGVAGLGDQARGLREVVVTNGDRALRALSGGDGGTAATVRTLVDVVVMHERRVVQHLDRGGQRSRALRLVLGPQLCRQLDKPRAHPLAARLDEPPHGCGDGFGVGSQLARELELNQVGEISVQLERELAVPWTIELDRENRLPPSEHEVALFNEQGGEAADQQLPAVGVPVDRFVQRDLDAPRKVVVQIGRVLRSDALEHRLKVAQQQRLVLVDRESEGRVQRLQVDSSGDQAGAAHVFAQAIREVDELSGVRAVETKAAADHVSAQRAHA